MGEDQKLTVEGCKRAIDIGVYPFVVPLRPVPGSLMEDLLPPSRGGRRGRLPPGRALPGRARACPRPASRPDARAARRARAWAPSRRRTEACEMDVVRSRWPSTSDARPASSAGRQTDPAELATHHRIRHAVFVAEQGLFQLDDRDVHDADAATIHVLGLDDGRPGGHRAALPARRRASGRATGWRCCREHRHSGGLGASLVRYAVATAGALGGSRMVAQIQPGNVRFFRGARLDRGRRPGRLPRACCTRQMSIALR